MIVVLSFEMITLSAYQNISTVADSSLIPISSEINVAHVTAAISLNISFLRSPNHGALTGITLSMPRILLSTRVVSASPSTSSAMMMISLFHFAAIHSSRCRISLIADIFLSVTNIAGFSTHASIRDGSDTK